MEAQCGSQHTRPEAQMGVDLIGRVLVVVQPGHMGADPDSDIRRYIEVSGAWIRLVLINRRAPVNRYAAWPRARAAAPGACSWKRLLYPGLLSGSFPRTLLSVAGSCGDELKDLIRGQRSVRPLFGWREDNVAGAQCHRHFCDEGYRGTGRYRNRLRSVLISQH